MRILVPLDGSPLAERALEPAVLLLRRTQTENTLILVRVVNPSTLIPPTLGDYSTMTATSLLDEVAAASDDYLRSVSQRELFSGLALKTMVVTGSPDEEICAVARKESVDLIAITSHGHTGLTRLTLGSVADAVARDAGIPTLIVRAEGETFPDIGRYEPLMILVPLDESALAELALGAALAIVKPLHGAIRLVEVLPEEDSSIIEHELRTQRAQTYIKGIHEYLERQGITTHWSLCWGDPAEQILAEAKRHLLDMVAIATHGRVGFDRLVYGSVTDVVLQQLQLPILVIHPQVLAAKP